MDRQDLFINYIDLLQWWLSIMVISYIPMIEIFLPAVVHNIFFCLTCDISLNHVGCNALIRYILCFS